MFDELFPQQLAANTRERAAQPVSTAPSDGYFKNFGAGAGNYFMRSMAEAGRAASMAGAVVPIAIDKMTEGDNLSGESLTDRYFKAHEDIFNHAVEYWTPKPGEVGMAGQIAGQLAGGVLQAVVNQALLVGTAQLSTAEDLVRQGVAPGAANVAGDIAGIGTAVGLRLPFIGQTLASRVASGVAGNVAQGAAVAGATHAVVDAAGNPTVAAQYDPLDARARILDAMLGAAFGGMAHMGAKLSVSDKDALLVANQARHIEEMTPGRPATENDLTMHSEAMRQSVGSVLRGEPVTVDQTINGMRMENDDAAFRSRNEVGDEIARIAGESGNEPRIEAMPPAMDRPDMMLPTEAFDANGKPIMVRAADAMAHADNALNDAKANAEGLFKTAANCLLGVL